MIEAVVVGSAAAVSAGAVVAAVVWRASGPELETASEMYGLVPGLGLVLEAGIARIAEPAEPAGPDSVQRAAASCASWFVLAVP